MLGLVSLKPGFQTHEENGQSAFETLMETSFPGNWKMIFFYPRDFTFVSPEIAEFASLTREFEDRNTIVPDGSTDKEFCKLAWRRRLHRRP
jgi:lipoyl-dependent peroxiredoxin subunit C